MIGDEFLIEFNLGEESPIESITLHVRGQGDAAIKTALKFTIPNQWSLYDLTVGELLDLNNPSDAGWKKFRAFRDQIF